MQRDIDGQAEIEVQTDSDRDAERQIETDRVAENHCRGVRTSLSQPI